MEIKTRRLMGGERAEEAVAIAELLRPVRGSVLQLVADGGCSVYRGGEAEPFDEG